MVRQCSVDGCEREVAVKGMCKPCYLKQYRVENAERLAEQKKQYYAENREHKLEYDKQYYAKNAERILERVQQYEAENRERINATRRARYERNPQFRLAKNLRVRMNKAFKGGFKSGSAVRDLGISMQGFVAYIERLFEPGMTLDNYGTAWHLDHIKPLASFDLTDREQFLRAAHYTNYQPLWAAENLAKSDNHDPSLVRVYQYHMEDVI